MLAWPPQSGQTHARDAGSFGPGTWSDSSIVAPLDQQVRNGYHAERRRIPTKSKEGVGSNVGYEDIIYEKKDGTAWITINRPDRLNSFRWETIDELTEAFQDADRDGTIGVIVLTGAGDRAFCGGGDIPTMRALDFNTGMLWNKKLLNLAMGMRNARQPVIAAVNGHCIGGGNELNLFCDLTISSDRAKVGPAGPSVGACPMWGATQ